MAENPVCAVSKIKAVWVAISVGSLAVLLGAWSVTLCAVIPIICALFAHSPLLLPQSPLSELLLAHRMMGGSPFWNAIGAGFGGLAVVCGIGLCGFKLWARRLAIVAIPLFVTFQLAVLLRHHGASGLLRCEPHRISAVLWSAIALLVPWLLTRRSMVAGLTAEDEEVLGASSLPMPSFAEVASGGFWRRLAAHLVDLVVLALVNLAVLAVAGIAISKVQMLQGQAAVGMVCLGLIIALNGLYYVALTAQGGQSLGKMLLRLRVVRADGSAVDLRTSRLRWLGYAVSYAALGLGYLWAAFMPDKRAFHDLLAGTKVVSTQPNGSHAGTAIAAVIDGLVCAALLTVIIITAVQLPKFVVPQPRPVTSPEHENPVSYYWLWRASQTTDSQNKISLLNRALPIIWCESNRAGVFIDRGNAHMELGDGEAALADFNSAIGISPDCAICYYGRAGFNRRLGRRQAALSDVNKAIALDPNQFSFYPLRGYLLSSLSVRGKAEAVFQEAVERFPKEPLAYAERGLFYSSIGRLDSGQTDLERALAMKPDFYKALTGIAEAHLGRGDYKAALKALESYPSGVGGAERGGMLMVKAMAHLRLGDRKSAEAYWSAAVELDRYYQNGPEFLALEGYTYPPKVWGIYGECFRLFAGSRGNGHVTARP